MVLEPLQTIVLNYYAIQVNKLSKVEFAKLQIRQTIQTPKNKLLSSHVIGTTFVAGIYICK
jgi:hypothetical protein